MPGQADLRRLPSVDQVLGWPALAEALAHHGRAPATRAVRDTLAVVRAAARAGASVPDEPGLAATILARLVAADRPAPRPVLNLTGTVLHTNFGRALLAEAAVEAAVAAMRQAAALEYDLETGRRGERDDHVRALLCELTGAEDATVVNNNAAAVLLALNALGQGRQAVVSRGELIEIGGAFRMPDIMARAGVQLVEVGTTNRTHPKDYRAAIGPDTGLILKVHTSNYRIEGFTAEVDGRTLAGIADEAGVPLLNDLGSGTLVDLSVYGLHKEPTVREAVAEGAGLVTFSGDKLLGGPQTGFIVGRRDLIARVNRNPMKRALRVDKIRLAALVATLKLYRDPATLAARLPTLRLLSRPEADIRAQAERLCPVVDAHLGPGVEVTVASCHSQIGSGALPQHTIPSAALLLRPGHGKPDQLAAAMRGLPLPVIGRIHEGAVVLDLRALEDEAGFLQSLAAAPPHGLA